MRQLYLIVLIFFVAGCASSNYVLFPNTNHHVQLDDQISKEEGQLVINFVSNNYEKFGGSDLPQDTKYKTIQSISKWHTPGLPTKEDLECQYSVNLSIGLAGNNFCIGQEKNNGQDQYKILGSTSWIQ